MRALVLPFAIGALAAAAVGTVATQPFDLVAGDPAFRRLVAGATPSGRVFQRAHISIPGLPRSVGGMVRVEVDASRLGFGLDGTPLVDVRPDRDGVLVMALPATGSRGAHIELGTAGENFALRKVSFLTDPPPRWPLILSFLAASLTTALVAKHAGRRLGIAAGLALSGFSGLAAIPAMLFLSLPGAGSVARLAVPILLLGASAVVGARARGYGRAVLLLGALVLGSWVRWYFLPSAGSWDTEYWKAWMNRALSAGVTRVYGDADATPPGQFVTHLLGREELFLVEYKGRAFVVDYPPLSMLLWRWSFSAVTAVAPELDLGEAENAAVKLPAVLGDVASVLLLLLLFRDRPGRGAALAAAYWALPVSWLSSAVLGFLDGAYAPVAILGLVAAGRGRAAASAVLVVLAGTIKPQALIVAPAALASIRSGAARGRAVAVGLGVVAVALLPFALAGTLEEAVTHVFRILFQQRLSAGYANPWWLVGHLANGGDLASQVSYARIDSLPFPAGLFGTALFFSVLALVLYIGRRHHDPRAVCLLGGTLVFAYGMLAMGVHENHPHSMFLAFAATGLASRRLRAIVSLLALSYVLNMLSLEALGRFYEIRHLAIEPLVGWVSSLRMSLGIDLTLLLVVWNSALFLWLLASLGRELEAMSALATSAG